MGSPKGNSEKQNRNNKKARPWLKQWKPGQSGNPAGRPPKEKTFSDTARMLLSATTIDITLTDGKGKEKRIFLKSTKNFYHGLVAALIVEGLKGNVNAIKELIDRAEGRPPQAISLGVGVLEAVDRQRLNTAEEMCVNDLLTTPEPGGNGKGDGNGKVQD